MKEHDNISDMKLNGFNCVVEFDPLGELSSGEHERIEARFYDEVDKQLPKWAFWVPEESAMVIPVEKESEFNIDNERWEEILNNAYEKATKEV